MSVIIWSEGSYDGDNRRLAMCGLVAVGAIFLPGPRGRYVRWRVWCTYLMNPAEGTARSVDSAKQEVEGRFERFLELAQLEPLRKVAP